MNWLTFMAATSGFYFVYYAALICSDLMQSPVGDTNTIPTLVFEGIIPEKVALSDLTPNTVRPPSPDIGASVGLGGISLKQVFELSRAKALEYTRPVSF